MKTKMTRLVYLNIIVLLLHLEAHTQVAPPKETILEEPNELNLGINLNTQASLLGGFTFKFNKQVTTTKASSFTAEFVNIRHPKEIRISNTSFKNSSSFVYGKYNSLLAIRTLYGKQFLLFNKAKDEGIEFSMNTSAGVIWGLEKPYYVLLDGTSRDSTGYFPYKNVTEPDKITGQGNLFMGLNQAKLVPGASFRLSAIIEFGADRSTPFGIEIGSQVDAFGRKIQILPYAGDKQVFISGFLVAYMGIRW